MIALLVNPAAGRGRALARAQQLELALARAGMVDVRRMATTHAGDERRIAREASAQGARMLVVVGGDGSVHHAARGLLDAPAPVPMAIVAGGTGNDFVKSLDTPAHDVDAMASLIAQAVTGERAYPIDVGIIDDVPFLNAAGFGFDVEVVERMQQHMLRPSLHTGTIGSGTLAYVSTALTALLGYRGFDAAVGTGTPSAHLLTVIANGRCFGGAFRIAPTASLDDGALDLVDIGALSPLARLAVFARATRGTHLTHPAVTHRRVSTLTLQFAEPPAFEADGELHQARGAIVAVHVRPAALAVVA